MFVLQNPLPTLTRALFGQEEGDGAGAELVVSGSFGDDCIFSGVVFFRSTQRVRNWLFLLLGWMFEHVYTHDQQTFSAFLSADHYLHHGVERPNYKPGLEKISSDRLFNRYLL